MARIDWALALSVVSLFGSSPLWGQAPLHTLTTRSSGAQLGNGVGIMGDINGDGFDDILVGGPYYDTPNGDQTGAIVVYSGLDASIIHMIMGESPHDHFGEVVNGAGDADTDGVPDIIVGANQDDVGGVDSGSATLISGAEGEVLFTIGGNANSDKFGFSVDGVGDVNGDGHDDFIVGALEAGINFGEGYARIHSGLSGSILREFNGLAADDDFGYSVSGVGDVNEDGVPDVFVGAPRANNNGPDSGSAYVFSGAVNEIELFRFDGDGNGQNLGRSVAGAGDVNGDGVPDLIVGAAGEYVTAPLSYARVYSGVDGAELRTFIGQNNTSMGFSVDGAGDVNDDGFADLIVGNPFASPGGFGRGTTFVFSGLDGSTLLSVNGDTNNDFRGEAVSATGDVNGDGADDVLIGAWADDVGASGSGAAYVYLGTPNPNEECDGDATGDGLVDPLDVGFVLARFGCAVGTGNEDCDSADQTADGSVDPLDAGFVLARFGECD